jgi:hypothetical protein
MRTVAYVALAVAMLGGIVFAASHSVVPKASNAGIDTLSLTKAAKSMPEEQYPAH